MGWWELVRMILKMALLLFMAEGLETWNLFIKSVYKPRDAGGNGFCGRYLTLTDWDNWLSPNMRAWDDEVSLCIIQFQLVRITEGGPGHPPVHYIDSSSPSPPFIPCQFVSYPHRSIEPNCKLCQLTLITKGRLRDEGCLWIDTQFMISWNRKYN